MSTIINSGQVGNLGMKNVKEQREQVINRWDQLGMLEGLNGVTKENMAILLENEASYLINELNESTTSSSSGSFETVAFPVIRRVFQSLLANEIVSVQALTMPIGRVYFFNPKISTRNSDGSHTPMDGAFSNAADNYSYNDEGRRTGKTGGTQYEETSLYDSFYATDYYDEGEGLFDRTSSRKFKFHTELQKENYAGAGQARELVLTLTGFNLDNRGFLIGPIGAAADTEEFMQSLTVSADTAISGTNDTFVESGDVMPSIRTLAQKYGKPIVDSSGNLKISIDLQVPDSQGGGYVPTPTELSGATFYADYSMYKDFEEEAEMPEVTFDFDYVTVDVGDPKQLRATYTPQIQQDVSAFHSIDVEAELTALLSETVAAEIDRGILRALRKGAAWSERFDYSGYDKMRKNGIGISRKDYNQELITKFNQISSFIMKTTLRGGANWVVVSPEIQHVLNDLEYFHASNAAPEQKSFSLGIEKIGTIQGRYSVYVDAYAPASKALIGHKGDTIYHAGYIYCPYVPLQLFPKMMNPNDFKSVLGIQARYATKFINNRFYGVVTVDNLPTVNVSEFIGS